MLRALNDLLRGRAAGDGPGAAAEERDLAVQVAAAALLVESSRADDHVHVLEHAAIAQGLASCFHLGADQVEDLLARAERARAEAVDLHGFTTLIVQRYDERQRLALAEVIWRVVFADGQLTADESILARRLGNLLDLRPEDAAIALNRARGQRMPPPAG